MALPGDEAKLLLSHPFVLHISYKLPISTYNVFIVLRSRLVLNVSNMNYNMNSVYSLDTIIANYAQFWYHRFRFDNFYVKHAPPSRRQIVENIDNIKEIIDSERIVRTVSIAQ